MSHPAIDWARQREFNRSTQTLGAAYAEHRSQLTSFIVDRIGAQPERKLAVLGAGNCNDLDLGILSKHFSEIQLFDVDLEALKGRSKLTDLAECNLVETELDLTGISTGRASASWSTSDLLEQLSRSPVAWLPSGIQSRFDVVLSACVLSQLMHEIVAAVSDKDGTNGRPASERALEEQVVRLIRTQHIGVMHRMLKSYGRGMLATDFLSTETCPELDSSNNLVKTCAEAVQSGNFFTGCNPLAIHAELQQNKGLGEVQLSTPWLWDLRVKRLAVTLHTFIAH